MQMLHYMCWNACFAGVHCSPNPSLPIPVICIFKSMYSNVCLQFLLLCIATYILDTPGSVLILRTSVVSLGVLTLLYYRINTPNVSFCFELPLSNWIKRHHIKAAYWAELTRQMMQQVTALYKIMALVSMGIWWPFEMLYIFHFFQSYCLKEWWGGGRNLLGTKRCYMRRSPFETLGLGRCPLS